MVHQGSGKGARSWPGPSGFDSGELQAPSTAEFAEWVLVLQEARELAQEEEFYYPHNLDFRGRASPIPPHLSYLGAALCRGLLLGGLTDESLKVVKQQLAGTVLRHTPSRVANARASPEPSALQAESDG